MGHIFHATNPGYKTKVRKDKKTGSFLSKRLQHELHALLKKLAGDPSCTILPRISSTSKQETNSGSWRKSYTTHTTPWFRPTHDTTTHKLIYIYIYIKSCVSTIHFFTFCSQKFDRAIKTVDRIHHNISFLPQHIWSGGIIVNNRNISFFAILLEYLSLEIGTHV